MLPFIRTFCFLGTLGCYDPSLNNSLELSAAMVEAGLTVPSASLPAARLPPTLLARLGACTAPPIMMLMLMTMKMMMPLLLLLLLMMMMMMMMMSTTMFFIVVTHRIG